MPNRITISPVTRIEGHLDIEATIDTVAGVQQVVDARCSGTMFRGIEILLKGRHPRDAVHITSRVCGVCPVSHAMASSTALENAYGTAAVPPDNGRILRNLILGADFLQSHVFHFYQLALFDYVDGGGVIGQPPSSLGQLAPDLVAGSEASSLLAHYRDAMSVRRKIGQLGAIFGGRMPCSPVFVPGGCTPTLSDAAEMATVGEPKASERIEQFRSLLDEIRSFVASAYLPDVLLLARKFPQYGKIGRGAGNFLAYGGFNLDASGSKKLLQRGVCVGGKVTSLDISRITESVKYSCYEAACGTANPSRGATLPDIDKPEAYSWIKSPRYMNDAYEVGPLARMWISGRYRQGVSVMDRLLARAYETQMIADAMADWVQELKVGEPTRAKVEYADSGIGVGLTEAPRGALGHWIEFQNEAIQSYQILAPTGWNASPMDESGKIGPIEQALIGVPVRDRDQPIELLRVVHSFDPCLACSIH